MLSSNILFFIKYFSPHFQLFRKESVVMAIKHAKFTLFCCHCWWQRFLLLMYNQFCCKIRQFWLKKFITSMKHKKNVIKFDERNIYALLYNLRHVIRITSFRMVNLLCCGAHFSNIKFFDAKTKYRSPYLLEIS